VRRVAEHADGLGDGRLCGVRAAPGVGYHEIVDAALAVATTGTPAALSLSAAGTETLRELLRRAAENTAGYATRATVVD